MDPGGAAVTGEIELLSDAEGLAVLGATADVDRFLLSSGLNRADVREIDLRRLAPFVGSGGAALGAGAEIAQNAGRWVKLTAESADDIRRYALMPTKTPGVSHAMVGTAGEIQKWVQIETWSTSLLSGPFALTALSTMMQQHALQEQIDVMVEYLQLIDEKVDDILRGQKDAVLADMIGVDLMIDEALIVQREVGRVSEVTWSKVQTAGMTIARTQAYAIRQLDSIADKLEKKADLGEIARATRDAERSIQEWFAVIARTFQLQDAIFILELDRILDAAPDELESHRLGLRAARESRLELVGSATARILTQMDSTSRRANAKVLLNPFDAPAAVKSSNKVAVDVLEFRERLGVMSEHETTDAKRWAQAVAEVGARVRVSATEGAIAAARLGTATADRATEAFRAVDIDGDGIPDKPRAAAAAEEAGAALKGAAAGVAGAFGTLFAPKRSRAASETSTESED